MSKRNFILLIIILIIVMIAVFGFLYLNQSKTTPTDPGTGTNFFSQFNPFGTTTTPPAAKPPVDVSGYEPPVTTPTTLKLMKVSTMPITGFTVFSKERLKDVLVEPVAPIIEGAAPAVASKKTAKKAPTAPLTEFVAAMRYVAKSNGNIYQTFVDKIQERKFSKTVIPRVYDSYFGNNGSSVVMRYLKPDDQTIETFIGTLPKELLGGDTAEDNEVKGSFLPSNIKDISISADTSKMFYLFENGNSGDRMIGVILNLLDNKKTQVFDSAFTEWLSQWTTNDKKSILALSTKPSSNVPGYMYTIDSTGKNLTKILGDINGLTTLMSPNGKLILYGDSSLSLNIYNTDTRNSNTLGIKTLPEKCVWGKLSDFIYCAVPISIEGGSYPDTWYQGEVSFDDQIWQIDVKNSNTTLIADPAIVVGGEEIDAIKLALDEGENYLFFVNKKDSFLWKLHLK